MPAKSKKRGNNEGSIYRRKDGLWCGQITIGRDESGKQKRQYFYGKTRQEVADKIAKALNDLKNGVYVDPARLLLKDWLNTWLWEYKKQTLRPSTFQDYESLINNHIVPAIGHYKLKDLRPEHLQALYNSKYGNGLSLSTIKHIHVILHSALDQALKNGLVVRNVSEATTLPKTKTKNEIRVLTLQEQQRFIAALEGERLRPAFLLALASGVRLGELLALKWDCVNLKEGTITIKRSLRRIKTYDKNLPTKTMLAFQEPKTAAGIRTIPVPPVILEELKEHRKRQLEERLQAGSLYEDNNLVFATELGTPIEPRNFLRVFYRIIEKANLDINFHALRHTYATRLLEANEHPKVVQELLGHNDISTTLNIYSHVMPEIKKAAAMKLNNLFENINIKGNHS
ncbi:integrase family protein [Caldicellulosiruptor acetigenus I77R1B]|uniref:Integrase family protein n=1 Tax=Caldicellulosiruptor acetigenus (strain ATCC 700853 / DSM 12137 / I77R1B) TaxID=632335 RepID=E4S5Y1_CALA7|nr:site-specific integrase [Caldicellulosiruptor acetigenus]ADQ39654.1 integrase family protein [Caldicellulosiruptor acetigenus I77R1B]